MQVWGENYWETYAPVVNWLSARLLMMVARIHGLSSKSIDFVLTFPQADLDVDIYMEIPAGMYIEDTLTNIQVHMTAVREVHNQTQEESVRSKASRTQLVPHAP